MNNIKAIPAIIIAADWASAFQWSKIFVKDTVESRFNKSGIWFKRPACFLSTSGTPVAKLDPKTVADAQAVITQYKFHDVSEKKQVLDTFSHSLAWNVKLFI